MGLTDNQKQLIKVISEGDIVNAKKVALRCIEEDKTQKNQYFCKRYKDTLRNQPNFMELPQNIKHLAIAEDMEAFNTNRYFISWREEAIVDHIRRMMLVGQRMSEVGISYVNTTLLHGESGTGKTTFAKYVAKTLGLPFVYLNFSQLIDSLMGKTSNNISKVFQYANNNKCVLMLDEIDCISIKRSGTDGNGTDGEMSRITISLMQEFDALSSDIVLIAATNRIDRIDEALLRRFSKIHEVVHLDETEMNLLAMQYLNDVGVRITYYTDEKTINQSTMIKQINELIAKHFEEEIKSR